MMEGTVFDIKRFSVHDGPGIRSTVFTKGCPLDCPWCQNPEGKENVINLWYFQNKCMKCNRCIEICPQGALSTADEDTTHIVIDKEQCTLCGKCVQKCPVNALAFDSKEMTDKEVVEILLKDKLFYETSGGGITISGGDPLFQHQFNLEILKRCQKQGIHTAIETCLFAGKKIVQQFIDVVDLFITDIKLFDSGVHKKIVGTDNKIIKNNFELLAAAGVKLLVRIPLIPGFTDREQNLIDIANYVYMINANIPVELINFNPLAENKYQRMNRKYKPDKSLEPFSEERLNQFKENIRGEGITVI